MVEKVTHLTKEGLRYYQNLLAEIKGKRALEIAKGLKMPGVSGICLKTRSMMRQRLPRQ